MGLRSVQIVRKPPKPIPEKLARRSGRRKMGQGGPKVRLAKAHAAARIGGSAPQVGGTEDLLVAGSKQEDELRDYESGCAPVPKHSSRRR
jgi:hypothetical protein